VAYHRSEKLTGKKREDRPSWAWHTRRMTPADVKRLEAAAGAYNRGDVEPLVALFDEDLDWRGTTRGFLWWRHTPGWHGPDEARSVLEQRLKQAALRSGYAGVELDEILESGERVLLAAGWKTEESATEPVERFFQVVSVRNGKIVAIQDYRSRRKALKGLHG
jgi:ketosteroid isomerase-like protein